MRARDIALIVLTVAIWGTNFVAIRWGLEEMPPFFLTALRFLLVLFPAIFFVPRPKTEAWKVFFIGLLVSFGQFTLVYLAMALGLPAGLASLLIQIQVAFTIILSFVIFHEKVSAIQLIGLIVAFFGFSFFFLDRSPTHQPILPILIVFVAALSWSFGNQIYKLVGDANRFAITIWSSLVPVVPLFVLSYIFEGEDVVGKLQNITMKGWLSVLFTAYFSTILAYSIWGYMMGKYKSILVMPWALTIPIFGFGSAAILLGEKITATEILAAALILSGLALCIFAPQWNNRRKAVI